MTRLRRLRPHELDARQRAVYDTIVHGRRADRPHAFPITDAGGGLQGPLNAWLLNPALGAAFEALGGAIAYDLGLAVREREVAVLSVAAHHDSPYELYAHRLAGARAGLAAEEIEALASGRDPGLDDPGERAVHTVVQALLNERGLDDDAYDRAVAVLGHTGLFELTTLVGFYSLLAVQLDVFGVVPPES